jgi:hypothetical protein
MSVNRFGLRRIGLATDIPRGRAIWIPQTGTAAGGGEFGAQIHDEDRTFAITREPVAHRVVFTVAHDIYDNWFKLELEGKEDDDTFDKQVQTELSRLKAKQELMRKAVFERAYGWAIIVLGYADSAESLAEPLANAKNLMEIKAYAPTQIPRVDEVKNKEDPRYGMPEYYNIKQSGIASYLKVHYTRVIHFANRLIDHDYKGLSVLDPVWDDIGALRNIRWGMGQTMYRYGSGFFDLTFSGAEQADINKWVEEAGIKNISNRSYFAHNELQKIDVLGFEGRSLNPMNYYLPIMENISAGTGVPLAILRGVQAGALTGSEVNQQEYYGLISDEQSGYEEGIRQLIKAIPQFQKLTDYTFNWQGGFELDEQKKAQIDLTVAQTLQIKGQWHTKNELRKMEDPNLPDLPNGEGKVLLGQSVGEGFDYHIREIPKAKPNITSSQGSRP